MNQSWTCPFCKRPTTITEEDIRSDRASCHLESDMGPVSLLVKYTVCPNKECKKMSLFAALLSQTPESSGYGYEDKDVLKVWNLIPDSMAKVYSPEIVPKGVIEDYEEACKIKNLSPKSSATLSRRALQGMIRDFWKVKKPKEYKGKWSLYHEIRAIKEKVDDDIWAAIDAMRDVGNIGAHMEENINVIIDVKPGEAEKLIGLIEMLIEEWYINRHERKERLKGIVDIAQNKKEQKNEGQKVAKASEN